MIRFPALLLSLAGILAAAPIDLRLPTENQHLFTGELDRFYMYVDRNFEGQTTKPWEAGSYGFVRTAIRFKDQILPVQLEQGDTALIEPNGAANNRIIVEGGGELLLVRIGPRAELPAEVDAA